MRKLASVRKVTEIRPIPDADMIELAIVDGWKCVVKKGEFAAGDQAIYCEIDSFLPIDERFEFLRKSSYKKMGEQEGFRLRTVKLRGQISQGLLLPASSLDRELQVGEDVTQELGILKYEAPTPACLTGTVVGSFPSSIEKTEEERIQNLADDYESYRGLTFRVTEKLDGTSFTAFLDTQADQSFGVCGRNWQYAEDDKNSYWRVAVELGLPEKLTQLGRRLAIQGELIGTGIQGNKYKLKDQQLFVFNIFDLDEYAYVPKQEASELCERLELNEVPVVELDRVPASIDEILVLAEGPSLLNPSTQREGLVWVHGSGQDRISFKTISNRFLAKEE